jgi:hypothetical protein
MNPSRLRVAVTLVLTGMLAGAGFFLGEAGVPAWAPMPILVGLVGSTAVAVLVAGRSLKKVSAGVGMLALYGLTFFLGLSSFSHAFGECVERGENLRVMLNEYRRVKGAYPETLPELGRSLPCDRISGRTILAYQRTANGYQLRFRDWLVEHMATEADSFMARK